METVITKITCQDKLYILLCPTRLTILISRRNVNNDESDLLYVSVQTRKRRREAVVSWEQLAGCANPALESYETTCAKQSQHQHELRLCVTLPQEQSIVSKCMPLIVAP